jgi:hypothetical protein
LAIELERPVGADRPDLHIGLAEGRARPTAVRGEHADLANESAGAERHTDLGHPNRPAENQEHRARRVTQPEQHVARLERATAHQRDEPLVGEITAAFAPDPADRSAQLQQAKAVQGEQEGMKNQHGIEMMPEPVRDEGDVAGNGDGSQRDHGCHVERAENEEGRAIPGEVHPVQLTHRSLLRPQYR